MPVLRSIRERFARERPLDGVAVAACLHVTAETANLVRALHGRRRAGRAVRGQPAVDPGRRRRRAARRRRRGPRACAARTSTPTSPTSRRCSTRRPQITLDDGADLLTLVHTRARRTCCDGMIGGTEETTTGLLRVRALEDEGRLALPGPGRQRGAHRARVQRPLRHRPVGARRHPARHQPAARRPAARRPRLRLDRPRRRPARPRRRRGGDRLRGRPAARARGADGRASRSCRRSRRPARGDVFVTVTGAPGVLRREHFERDEGRRGARQRRPLRRRDRPRRAARAGRRRPRRAAARRRSTTSAAGA